MKEQKQSFLLGVILASILFFGIGATVYKTIVGTGSPADNSIVVWDGVGGNRIKNTLLSISAAGFELNWTVFCEIRSNYLYGTTSSADGYAIKINSDTSSCLVEDNILGNCFYSIIASQHAGCVFAYNFSTNSWVNNGFVGITRAYNCNHGPHALMSLWEGNVGSGFLNDGYHGSGSHQTVFRNYFPSVQNIYSNAHMAVIDLRRWSYYNQIVGNILGENWATNHVKYFYNATEAQWNAASSIDNGTIYLDGNYTSPYDAQVSSTATKAYNWDGWNQGVVNNTGPPVSSLFRDSKPSWFGSVPFPPIGPDVVEYKNPIPAQLRFYGISYQTKAATIKNKLTVGTFRIGQ